MSRLLWCLLDTNGRFLSHGSNDRDNDFLAITKHLFDLFTKFTLRKFDIILGTSSVEQEAHETVIDVNQGKFITGNVGDFDVVGGWAHVLILLCP